MSRFSASVQDAALARSGGQCEECGGQLKPGQYEFDHKKPRGLGGDDTLENCVVLCRACHLQKTMSDDMPPMRQADRKGKRKVIVARGESEIARRFKRKE